MLEKSSTAALAHIFSSFSRVKICSMRSLWDMLRLPIAASRLERSRKSIKKASSAKDFWMSALRLLLAAHFLAVLLRKFSFNKHQTPR